MSQETVNVARNAVAAFNRRDVPALVELTTDDFQWVTWTGTVETTVYDGAEGLAGYFQDADIWEVLNLDVAGVPRPRRQGSRGRNVPRTRWWERRRGPGSVLLRVLRQ